MRLLAGLAIALSFGATTGVAAQNLSPMTQDGDSPLRDAAFAKDFAPRSGALSNFSDLIEREQYRSDGAAVRWDTSELKLGQTKAGSVDSLRIGVGGALRTDSGLPQTLDHRAAQFDADAYEVAVTRDWAPVRFDAGKYDVHLTPHTGLGVSNAGGQAEAGAVLTVGQKRDDAVVDQLSGMGVRDGASYGDTGRWYLFAAASGRAVGLNMLRQNGGWDRDGWSTDRSSALIGDAHVGVGYRKGVLQGSLGYIHREVKGDHMVFGQQTKEDSLLAFSLSIKPQR